jgi:hypothetical protein
VALQDSAVNLPFSWRTNEVAIDENVSCVEYGICLCRKIVSQGDCGWMLEGVGNTWSDLCNGKLYELIKVEYLP